jgi:hypothetical protein
MRAVDVVKLNWVAKVPWEFKYPLALSRLRYFGGVVLLILTAILYGSGRAGWWTALLPLAAAAEFWGAYRIPIVVAARQASTKPEAGMSVATTEPTESSNGTEK